MEGKTDKALEAEQEGELWLRSGAVMKGYLNDASETEKCLDNNGWLQTG